MSDERTRIDGEGAERGERASRASTLRPPAPMPAPRRQPPRPLVVKRESLPGDAPFVSSPTLPNDRPTPRSTVIPRLPAPIVLSAMRPPLQTLIFHGAPPIPPPLPKVAREEERPSFEDVASSELLRSSELLPNLDDDDDARPTPFQTGIACTDRPPPPSTPSTPPPRAASGRTLAIGIAAAVVLPLAVLGITHRSAHPPPEAPPLATSIATATKPTLPVPLPQRIAGTCEVAPASHLLARRAIVRGGIEATALGDRVAFATLTSLKTGAAFDLDATSLAVHGSARIVGERPLARVVPELVDDGPIDVLADTGPLRTLPDADGDSAIGARDGFVTWGPRDGDGMVRLWKLDWPPTIEAPRVAVLGTSGERAVVLRRQGAIWVGSFRGGSVTTDLARLSSPDPHAIVGSPSIDAHGDEAIVAWAERTSQSASWGIRFVRWTSHGGPGALHDLALPPGGPGERAMAPSVAALDASRFLLAWTEAGHGRNQVRAQVFDAADHPLGAPLEVSPSDAIAGQEQIALVDSTTATRGAIAYLVAHRGAFELRATSIDCTK